MEWTDMRGKEKVGRRSWAARHNTTRTRTLLSLRPLVALVGRSLVCAPWTNRLTRPWVNENERLVSCVQAAQNRTRQDSTGQAKAKANRWPDATRSSADASQRHGTVPTTGMYELGKS